MQFVYNFACAKIARFMVNFDSDDRLRIAVLNFRAYGIQWPFNESTKCTPVFAKPLA